MDDTGCREVWPMASNYDSVAMVGKGGVKVWVVVCVVWVAGAWGVGRGV